MRQAERGVLLLDLFRRQAFAEGLDHRVQRNASAANMADQVTAEELLAETLEELRTALANLTR